MRRVIFPLALVATVSGTAIASAQSSLASPGTATSLPASSAVIRPGDAVQITVWRKPELSGEFHVADDGSIAHPFYQEVNVSGVTATEAAERVQRFLELYETSPRVRVDPLYRVSVAGQVRQPKLYNLRPDYTIADAIDEAGGPADRGRLDRIRLFRNGQVHNLNLSTNSAADMRIQSGDRIVVERDRHVMRDVVVPTVSFVGSIASLVHIWLRYRR